MKPLEYTFVWALSDTTAYRYEWVDWCGPQSTSHLAYECKEFIRNTLDNLYSSYSEWFNLADYPDAEESALDELEIPVFRAAAGVPADYSDRVGHDFEVLDGVLAVLSERLKGNSIEQLKSAAELFHWIIQEGLANCDEGHVHASVWITSLEEFAPRLVDHILVLLAREEEELEECSWLHPDPSGVAATFGLRKNALYALEAAFKRPGWTEETLVVKLFFRVAEEYKRVIEQ